MTWSMRTVALVSLLSSGVAVRAQVAFPAELPNSIDIVRDADDYKFIASLFPQKGPAFKPENDTVMSDTQRHSGEGFLSDQLDVQKKVYRTQRTSVLMSLQKMGVIFQNVTLPNHIAIVLKDDQMAWANAASTTEIILGARFLRGLVLGSLQETVKGGADFSRSLGAYLGETPLTDLSIGEIEARARLFFAAGMAGKPEMRTEEDMDEAFRRAVDLMKNQLGKESHAEVFSALQKRLQTAAAGGPITGVDGAAMFDVFMRLEEHERPAVLFVLSHELGHTILGNVPFPPNATCSDMQHREDDADRFAIALLVYDMAGDEEAEDLALSNLKISKSSDETDHTLDYGYSFAIRYGFGLGGATNKISDHCSYREPADRIAFIDGLRSALVATRVNAFQRVFASFHDHPPYLYVNEELDDWTPAKRAAFARRLYPRCHAGPPPNAITARKVKEPPFGWAVPCANPLPPSFQSTELKAALGPATAQAIRGEYTSRLPGALAFDEDRLDQLTRQ